MLFFGNGQLAKINRKQTADFDNQFNLIKQEQSKLYKAYSNPQGNLWQVLNSLSDYITITIVNDAQYTFNLDLQNATSLWDKNTEDSHQIDKVDCMIVNKVINWEADLIAKLTRIIYEDITDTKIRNQIAHYLVEYATLVNSVSEASHVDDNYSYSWGQYFSGQMFTISFLNERVAELIQHPELAYTMFSGNEILFNHQLPFTGKEYAGKQVYNNNKRKQAMAQAQAAQRQGQMQGQSPNSNGNNTVL